MNTTVSVCMATYNGERWVAHQLRSILAELNEADEIVVVDDASTDGTAQVVASLDDPRIRLHRSPLNRGYVRTFEDAMGRARGDVLFLSDQDDEWVPGRRAVLVEALERRGVAASNIVLLGSDAPLRSPVTGRDWRLRAKDSDHRVRNDLRMLAGVAPYYGCAMALRREALGLALPFPDFLDESHDLWIAAVANSARLLVHVETPTVRRRVHGENASTDRPRGLRAVLRSRMLMLRLLREARKRSRRLAVEERQLLGAR